MIKIATWNVNSVKARLPHLLRWLDEFSPDVVLLQELKCVAEAFPHMEVEDKGYNIAVAGQKTYNGVAILSKSPIDIELTELPGDPSDEQARYIEGFTGGDYNVIPEDADVHEPESWRGDALFRPETHAAWRKLIYLGLTDAFRVFNPEAGRYSYWDYRAGAWNKDHGIRIDHLLLSPQAADLLTASGVDRTPRGWEKPSDHTPVWCEISDPSVD